MKISKFLALAPLLALAACAQQSVKPNAADSEALAAKAAAQPTAAGRPARTPQLPNQELSRPILFKMLLAEIALQRGQANVAVQSYLELTRETKDPRIAQRATEVAWSSRFPAVALEAAGIWLAADPESPQALQVVVGILINQGRLTEAQPYLERSLASEPENAGVNFMQLGTLLARHPDKAAVLQLTQSLAERYPLLPEAHYSVARAASSSGENVLALAQIREALRLRPDWEQAALLQGQILQLSSIADAAAYFQGYLKSYPRAMDVRLSFARLLVAEKKYAEARTEFQVLLKEFPNNPDVTMAVGLLALQLNDYDAAETQLMQALRTDYKDPDAIRYYLGQLNEDRERLDDALRWYSSINDGEQYVPSHARYAAILAKQGKLSDARKYLQESARNAQQRVQFTQVEAQLLRDATEYGAAYDVLGSALEKAPESAELLYDQAMVAEKLDRIDVLEANLRKVIQLRPDYAHAYNSLGYTLADRNVRLNEAYTLIEQALKLAPDDAFIMDSMGWVLYRLGQYDAAMTFLKQAFASRPDPEIAAHLGEVLWATGQREAANKIWNGALKENPGNETLLATVKKFIP